MPYRIDLPALDNRAFDRLVGLGALDVESTTKGRTAALMPDRVTPDEVSSALGVTVLGVAAAEERDAGSVWVLRPRPVHVGGVRIVPAHYQSEPGTIRLTDARAFGTGLHPTTVLCLQTIQDVVGHAPPSRVLDVGTGSGVLALAALTLGVPRAVGLDIDPAAMNAAAANARLNDLGSRLRLVRGGPAAVIGAWPLVMANLLTGPLLELAPELVRRVGHRGQLLLSGIRSSTRTEVENAYVGWGMHSITSSARDGWVALLLQASW